jgi:hypothetical protein
VLFADGHSGADTGCSEERRYSRARCTHAFGERALRHNLELDLSGTIQRLEHDRI